VRVLKDPILRAHWVREVVNTHSLLSEPCNPERGYVRVVNMGGQRNRGPNGIY